MFIVWMNYFDYFEIEYRCSYGFEIIVLLIFKMFELLNKSIR